MFSPKHEEALMSLSRKTVIYMLCVAAPAAPEWWRKFTPFCARASFLEDAGLALSKRRMCSVVSEHGSAVHSLKCTLYMTLYCPQCVV